MESRREGIVHGGVSFCEDKLWGICSNEMLEKRARQTWRPRPLGKPECACVVVEDLKVMGSAPLSDTQQPTSEFPLLSIPPELHRLIYKYYFLTNNLVVVRLPPARAADRFDPRSESASSAFTSTSGNADEAGEHAGPMAGELAVRWSPSPGPFALVLANQQVYNKSQNLLHRHMSRTLICSSPNELVPTPSLFDIRLRRNTCLASFIAFLKTTSTAALSQIQEATRKQQARMRSLKAVTMDYNVETFLRLGGDSQDHKDQMYRINNLVLVLKSEALLEATTSSERDDTSRSGDEDLLPPAIHPSKRQREGDARRQVWNDKGSDLIAMD